ncbi:MarC family protein [Rhabdaerophilum sp. SD176]|uniref:MarC family protein n=1 Tax=Rhabdaerophilum sp. SD176 TaxID=2983548 RepID=UPI0024E009A3|nr:MarC family protein [Rhabdaerophilum sp. SD176]
MSAAVTEYFLAALTTLMVTVDPPGLAPIFLSLTVGLTPAERRNVAVRATIIAGAIMLGFAFFGQPVLGALGIGFPAFRIAGGLLLFWIAFEMIFELRGRRKNNVARTAIDEDHIRNIAAFPLAIPLMAGPGTITATMLIAGSAGGDGVKLGALVAVIALVSISCLLVFLIADRLSKLLGVTGNLVLTRLLGVILAALAVQFVIDGIKAVR